MPVTTGVNDTVNFFRIPSQLDQTERSWVDFSTVPTYALPKTDVILTRTLAA